VKRSQSVSPISCTLLFVTVSHFSDVRRLTRRLAHSQHVLRKTKQCAAFAETWRQVNYAASENDDRVPQTSTRFNYW